MSHKSKKHYKSAFFMFHEHGIYDIMRSGGDSYGLTITQAHS